MSPHSAELSFLRCTTRRHRRPERVSVLRADLLHDPVRRLNRALHPPIPTGRMLTRKENPAFPSCIYWNPAKLTGTKRRKTSALPRILAPALCSNRFELLPRPRKHALRIGKRPLHTALHIHGIKLCRSLSNDVRQQQAPLVRRLRPERPESLRHQIRIREPAQPLRLPELLLDLQKYLVHWKVLQLPDHALLLSRQPCVRKQIPGHRKRQRRHNIITPNRLMTTGMFHDSPRAAVILPNARHPASISNRPAQLQLLRQRPRKLVVAPSYMKVLLRQFMEKQGFSR